MAPSAELIRPAPGPVLLGQQDELEPDHLGGRPVKVRTLFLRGSQCRFRCRMCDLWQFTHPQPTQVGDIQAQVADGVRELIASGDASSGWLKLYNASNFFDPFNVPLDDLPGIASLGSHFQRVVVENHPRVLPWSTIMRFRDQLAPGRLEIALGLETVNRQALRRLNKQATLEHFADTMERLKANGIDVRAFVLLGLPDMPHEEAAEWCQRSIQWCLDKAVRHISVIPLRTGLSAMQSLVEQGRRVGPTAHSLELILADNLRHEPSIVTVDLWDWNRLSGTCNECSALRRARLESMNLQRSHVPPISCENCDAVN